MSVDVVHSKTEFAEFLTDILSRSYHLTAREQALGIVLHLPEPLASALDDGPIIDPQFEELKQQLSEIKEQLNRIEGRRKGVRT